MTNRHGGVSEGPYESLNLGDHVGDDPEAVRANRERVAVGIGVDRLTMADQRHGARVAVVDRSNAGAGHAGAAEAAAEFGATDALVTAEPGVALAVLVADCAPVVLWDEFRRVLAVAHCGRPGAVLDVVGATVEAMAEAF
ncbi:MAG: laccase domain-containing protein, partial [Acidimicrobiia bacterium]|nr:laccase domain-containing protein [Acidimicrobiia bacterium]